MPKKTEPASPETVALFEKVVATLSGIERKGDTIPYTSLNGHMFAYVSKDGFVALRLPELAREEFLTKYDTTLSVQYGITQKEYVVVPDALLRKTAELKKYFAISHTTWRRSNPSRRPEKRRRPDKGNRPYSEDGNSLTSAPQASKSRESETEPPSE